MVPDPTIINERSTGKNAAKSEGFALELDYQRFVTSSKANPCTQHTHSLCWPAPRLLIARIHVILEVSPVPTTCVFYGPTQMIAK